MAINSQVALNLSSAWLHTHVSGDIPSAGASLSILTAPQQSVIKKMQVTATSVGRDMSGDDRREERVCAARAQVARPAETRSPDRCGTTHGSSFQYVSIKTHRKKYILHHDPV